MSSIASEVEKELFKVNSDKFKKIASFILDKIPEEKIRIEVFPDSVTLGTRRDFEISLSKEIGLSIEELRQNITILGFMLMTILSDDEGKLLKRVREKDETQSKQIEEIISFLKKESKKYASIRDQYFLRLYSKTLILKDIEWDAEIKYYHSDRDREVQLPMGMVRLIFDSPLSFENGKGTGGKDITFDVSLDDIKKIQKSLQNLEENIQKLKK